MATFSFMIANEVGEEMVDLPLIEESRVGIADPDPAKAGPYLREPVKVVPKPKPRKAKKLAVRPGD
jgi:hypothetical protein